MMRLILVLALFVATNSRAAEVSKVKGQAVLINLQGESTSPGQMYYTLKDGKKAGIVQIRKVHGDKAIGNILKGTAESGMTLAARPGHNRSDANSEAGGASARRRKKSAFSDNMSSQRGFWGVMAGFSADSMSVNVNDWITNQSRGTVSLSGNGMSAMALFDYEVFPQIWFRGLGGLEQFNASGMSVCSTNNKLACTAKISYLAGHAIGRYVFAMGNLRPWGGVGLELLFPASKQSTALNASSIGSTTAYGPQLGVDWFVSPTLYIPISLEYMLLPKSNEVDAHWVGVRVGAALPF